MKDAIICDIDGCVVDTDWIWSEIEKQKLEGLEKWDFFNKNSCNLEKSKINPEMIMLLNGYGVSNKNELIFSTARSEEIRTETRAMLHKIFPDREFLLFMRPADCVSTSDEVKKEHLVEILKNYNIKIAIDNENQNCQMYRKEKIPCLRRDNFYNTAFAICGGN